MARLLRQARLLGVAFLCALGLLVVGVQPAVAATTWYVDGNFGNDLNSCTGPGLNACRTIQAAVNKASSGDTIIVAAAVYVESVGVDKGLLIEGPNFGVSPNGGIRGPEAFIDGGGGTTIRISTNEPVTVDGFTFSGGLAAFIDSYTTGNKPIIRHNIFTAQVDSFFFANSDSVTFEDNYLHDLTDCGPCEGLFLAGNWNGSNGTVASIKDNVWLQVGGPGMNLSNVSGTISGNRFSLVTYYGALLANGTNVTVSGNTFDNTINPVPTVPTWGAGVRFYTPSTGFGARITDNTFFANYVGIGVRMGSPTADITGMDVYAHQNNFEGNTTFGIRHDGLGTFNATCNWWNSPSGPRDAGNPGGTGDAVSGPVNYSPWLTAPAPGGSCAGVVPSTPGKVTGGGQLDGDPLFSPLGELISLPALVPSISGATSKATFGFAVKCCSPSGNLEYKDHGQDVRIKALSIDGLFITSPGTACPATPGSKHAKFTGTATVTQPSGTTTEPFTVNVDDCGEPGTADTFGIKTTSYSAGPSTLAGGNIQIHK
jgi:hypothetical protein